MSNYIFIIYIYKSLELPLFEIFDSFPAIFAVLFLRFFNCPVNASLFSEVFIILAPLPSFLSFIKLHAIHESFKFAYTLVFLSLSWKCYLDFH